MCWRLERLDGAGIALTSHDDALTCEAHSIRAGARDDASGGHAKPGPRAAVGRGRGRIEQRRADPKAICQLGRWDGARVRLAVVDWRRPEDAPIQLLGGEIGNIGINGDSFSAELRGAAAALEGPVCPATSPECRAQFGDKKCRIDLAGRTVGARVVAVDGGALTLDASVDERFVLGRLRYMSGANCGLTTMILSASGQCRRGSGPAASRGRSRMPSRASRGVRQEL